MFALRERRVHVTQARTRSLLQPFRNTCPSAPAEPAACAMDGRQTPSSHPDFELPAYWEAALAVQLCLNCSYIEMHSACARAGGL